MLRATPGQQAARKWGPLFYNYKEPNSPNNWWIWKRTPTLCWDCSPGWMVDFSLMRPWAKDPATLCLDSWIMAMWNNKLLFFLVTKSVVICYTAIENEQTFILFAPKLWTTVFSYFLYLMLWHLGPYWLGRDSPSQGYLFLEIANTLPGSVPFIFRLTNPEPILETPSLSGSHTLGGNISLP